MQIVNKNSIQNIILTLNARGRCVKWNAVKAFDKEVGKMQ